MGRELSAREHFCSAAGCQGALHRIGEDVSEQLHIPPQTPWVWQHVRFKYGCRHCERHGVSAPVVRAAMPAQPLPGSVADAATIATVMTGKYTDGMPLYRMEAVLGRAGIELGRDTMGHWMIGASQRHLQRLYDTMHSVLLSQSLIHGDETRVQVLHEDGKSAQSQSYMWVYRSAEASPKPVVLFEYQPGRAQQHPQTFLKGYAGMLMTDGYSAWRTLDGVAHLGCMAHARRYTGETLPAPSLLIAQQLFRWTLALIRITQQCKRVVVFDRAWIRIRRIGCDPRRALESFFCHPNILKRERQTQLNFEIVEASWCILGTERARNSRHCERRGVAVIAHCMWQNDRVCFRMWQVKCATEHMAKFVVQCHSRRAKRYSGEPCAIERFAPCLHVRRIFHDGRKSRRQRADPFLCHH
jgi:transposase